MAQYAGRRIIWVIVTLLLVSMLVFSVVRLIPGDIVDLMVGENAYAANEAALRAKLGLDRPVYIQYFVWAKNLLRGDLGESLWSKMSALGELKRRVPLTGLLTLLAIFMSLIIAIPVGVLSAVRQDTMSDYVARTLAIAALAIPHFWLATLIIVFPAIWWGWTPPVIFAGFADNPLQSVVQLIIPAAILAVGRAGETMRMTRAMMLEVLRQDYIRTAWSKGLREHLVIYRHALKNAMIPVVTLVGLQVPYYLGGAVILEYIFGIPGVGRFLVASVTNRDYPMLQAMTLFFAASVVFANLIVDLAYGWLDPRIRYG